MLFEFVFILSLTLVVGYASNLVWKTEYSIKEKRILVGTLFGLLSLVIIINEGKNRNYITFSLLGMNENDCSIQFYSISDKTKSQLQHNYPLLPMSYKHSSEIIQNNFGTIDHMPESIHHSFFYLAISDDNSGASHLLKHYAIQLQQNNSPALYLRLTKNINSLSDLENAIQIKNIDILNKTIQRMNHKKNLIPFIIIDNYQYAFNDGNSNNNDSILTKILLDFYLQYQIKIILHTHQSNINTLIYSVPRAYQVVDIIRYKSINAQHSLEYILEHYSETTKGITLEQLQLIDDYITLDYQIISSYATTYDQYQTNTLKFIEDILRQYETIINNDEQLKDFLKQCKEISNVNEKVINSNKLITLHDLKNKHIQNLQNILIKYESQGIITLERAGYITFNKRYFNSLFLIK